MKPKLEKLGPMGGYSSIIRQIMGRCHVGESNRAALRHFTRSFKDGLRTAKKFRRCDRKRLWRAVLKQHAANRSEYNAVMSGIW